MELGSATGGSLAARFMPRRSAYQFVKGDIERIGKPDGKSQRRLTDTAFVGMNRLAGRVQVLA